MLRFPSRTRIAAVVVATSFALITTAAQPPQQFKANMKVREASSGVTSTGMLYFGGAKMRVELTQDGEQMVVISDGAAGTQTILMPSDKIYMQMSIGQGPFNAPVRGSMDPTNPCSSGGVTDCVKGPNETISGYETRPMGLHAGRRAHTRVDFSHASLSNQDDR
jgi:hypothetical protein